LARQALADFEVDYTNVFIYSFFVDNMVSYVGFDFTRFKRILEGEGHRDAMDYYYRHHPPLKDLDPGLGVEGLDIEERFLVVAQILKDYKLNLPRVAGKVECSVLALMYDHLVQMEGDPTIEEAKKSLSDHGLPISSLDLVVLRESSVVDFLVETTSRTAEISSHFDEP